MKPIIYTPDYLVELEKGLYGIPLSEYVSEQNKKLVANYYVDITINHVFKYDNGIITKCDVSNEYATGEWLFIIGDFGISNIAIRTILHQTGIDGDTIKIGIRYVVDDEFDSIKLYNGVEVIPIEYRMDDRIVYMDTDMFFWQEYLVIDTGTIVPTIERVTKRVKVPDNIVEQTKLEFKLNDTRRLRFKLNRLSRYIELPKKVQHIIYVDRLGNLYVKHLGGYIQVIPDSNDVYYVGIGRWIPRNHIIKALNGWNINISIKELHKLNGDYLCGFNGDIINPCNEIKV